MSITRAVLSPRTIDGQNEGASTTITAGDQSGVIPDSLQTYADNCFSSSKNFYQCKAAIVPPLKPLESLTPLAAPTPSQIGVHRVVNGWFIDCCDPDLDLDKCNSAVDADTNCAATGNYTLYADPNATSSSTSASVSPPSNASISSGAIAGAVVGSVAGTALLAILAAALIWRKRKTHQEQAEKLSGSSTSSYPADVKGGLPGVDASELPGTNEQHELPTANEQHELPSSLSHPPHS